MRQSKVFCININFIAYTQRCRPQPRRLLRFFGGFGNAGENVPLPQTILIFIIWQAMAMSVGGHFSAENCGGVGLNGGKIGKWKAVAAVGSRFQLATHGAWHNDKLRVES